MYSSLADADADEDKDFQKNPNFKICLRIVWAGREAPPTSNTRDTEKCRPKFSFFLAGPPHSPVLNFLAPNRDTESFIYFGCSAN